MLKVEERFVHVEVLGVDQMVKYYATIVYALN